MLDKLNIQKLGETEVPLKCDNYVLAMIQEEYETLNNFEMKLLGLSILEIDGKIQKDENGKTMFLKGEPSLKAIQFALPLMISEGLAYAKDLNMQVPNINIKVFMKELIMDHNELASVIHNEFTSAFATKN